MSTARFTGALADIVPTVQFPATSISQDSSVTASFISQNIGEAPRRHYVWIYDIAGVKADVVA